MANPEHPATLKKGVRQWNKWREEHPDVTPDLHGGDLGDALLIEADLSGADLSMANLWKVDLSSANLSYANLVRAHLREANLLNANLRGADLTGANLTEADFMLADLSGANLGGADLVWAHLDSANLSGTNFTGVTAYTTTFSDLDLSAANGLETIKHGGPCTIGIDTIYKSQGKIPDVFLRGCGVPDEFIAYIGSMVGRPIEYYSCFISYSIHDQEFAERLHADLQAQGGRSWFAPHDIKGGRKIHEQIDEAIRLHDRLLLILSEHSLLRNQKTTFLPHRLRPTRRIFLRILSPLCLAKTLHFRRINDLKRSCPARSSL